MKDLDEELKYIKGFNHGYELMKWKPDLYNHVEKGFVEQTNYTDGFADGGKQFEKERRQEQIKERLQPGRKNERSK